MEVGSGFCLSGRILGFGEQDLRWVVEAVGEVERELSFAGVGVELPDCIC